MSPTASPPNDVETQDGILLLSAFRKVAQALGLTVPEQAANLGVW